MKHTLLFATIASFVVVHAYANNIVTSKTYVDNRDALKVDIAQGVGTNNANVGKTLVVNASGNLELGTPAAGNYVEDSITDDVTTKAPSENAVHDALAGKQNTITTAEVAYTEPEEQINYQLPSLVAYDSTNGLSGNQIGILDFENGGVGLLFLAEDMDPWDSSTAVYDNYVPTMRTVAIGLRDIWDNMPTPFAWISNDTMAVNNYSVAFDGGTGNWPGAHGYKHVNGNSLAQGLALKQNKIPARATKIADSDSTYAPSVVTNTANAGDVGQMAIITGNRIFNDHLNWDEYVGGDSLIPTLSAVGYVAEDVAANRQDKIPASEWETGGGEMIPGVVISTDTDGGVEQRMILDKTQDIEPESIDDLVTLGYDDGSGMHSSISYDIHDNSVSASDVNNAVPTTTMTVAIAKSAASQAVANKQDKIPGHAANAADSVLTDSTTAGTVQKRAILDMQTFRALWGVDDLTDESEGLTNMIPDAGTVGVALGEKQNILGGGRTAGKVVTATATQGDVTYTGIDTTVTNASSNLVTSGGVYTAVNAKQTKKTCAGWLDGTTVPDSTHTDANCVLWNLPD